jgi:UMP-CMP kinase
MRSCVRRLLARPMMARSVASSANQQLPKVIFVLGPPGSGKSTQSQLLAQEFGMVHLSAGELLRREQVCGSREGKIIDQHLKEGKIVPVEITLSLLRKEMAAKGVGRYVIDGFPRNEDNLQGWTQHMSSSCTVDKVLFIDSPQAVLENRLLLRGRTSGRDDDNVESIRKRFVTYVESTYPIIEHYRSTGQLVHISGLGGQREVYNSVKAAVEQLLKQEIAELTQRMLDMISDLKFEEYKAMCVSDMTCFEPEAKGALVSGVQFHGYYLDDVKLKPVSKSTLCSPAVRIMGKTAVIAYQRVIQAGLQRSELRSDVFEETRVWQLVDGHWKCVHFHRSAPS